MSNEASSKLAEKIKNRTARVGVVGLGYVGLPLAVEYAQEGFDVTGIDLSEPKTESINRGESYIGDVPSAALEPLVKNGKLRATTDFSVIWEPRHDQHLRADSAAQDEGPRHELHRVGHAGDRAVLSSGAVGNLESTTYPGTTATSASDA